MTTTELMGQTTTFSVASIMRICPSCGIPFSIPESYYSQLNEHHVTFYCPNGHSMWQPTKTEAEKLKEQIERERQEAERKAQQLQARIESRDRDISDLQDKVKSERGRSNYHKGKRKVIEARAAHGVCTCCNRTFHDLAKHMASKHPEELVKR